MSLGDSFVETLPERFLQTEDSNLHEDLPPSWEYGHRGLPIPFLHTKVQRSQVWLEMSWSKSGRGESLCQPSQIKITIIDHRQRNQVLVIVNSTKGMNQRTCDRTRPVIERGGQVIVHRWHSKSDIAISSNRSCSLPCGSQQLIRKIIPLSSQLASQLSQLSTNSSTNRPAQLPTHMKYGSSPVTLDPESDDTDSLFSMDQ